MLRVLEQQIGAYRAEIEKLFTQHPDHDLFGSLPGAGPKIAPRLLGEIGSERARFDTSALQCLAGTAPISYQSGQIHSVALRAPLKQVAAGRRASVGESQPASLSLGSGLLPSPAGPRQIPCLRSAMPGPALAQDPLATAAMAAGNYFPRD